MKRKKKILILTPAYDEPHRTMGSAPKIARQLSKHVEVIVVSGGSSNRVEQRSKNLRVYFLKEWLIPDPVNNGPIPFLLKKLKRILREEKPDVILNLKHMFYMNMAALWLKWKGYRVVTVTDTFPGINWWSASWVTNSVMWVVARSIGKWILRRSDKVILYHSGLIPVAQKFSLNYVVIPNGVEFDVLEDAKKLNFAGKIRIIYVGRLESVKGYDTILTAAKDITNKFEKIHFSLIADLQGKEHLVEEFACKQIHFEGRKTQSEVYSYMKGADIVVLASKSEGLPNALLEAMACGCVPICTPVGAINEVLLNGKLGKLYSYQDVSALKKHIVTLICDPQQRKKLSGLCKSRIKEDYNWEYLAQKYLRVIFDNRNDVT